MTVDVVVVAYRSAAHLRACVEPLCDQSGISVIVVDNACPERSPATLDGLPVHVVDMGRNAGFAAGCNAGARAGGGAAVLFLNPDARMAADEVRTLAGRLEADPVCGAIGPRILETNGDVQPSMRHEPSLLAAFGEALFLHHAIRSSDWPTEIVRRGYDRSTEAGWLSGAVLMVSRSAFEAVGGFDERLFMYSEDTDLCTRLRERGFRTSYDPAATARHEGGASAPRAGQAAMRAAARVTYARLHFRGLRYAGFRVAYALHELMRLPLAAARSRTHVRSRLAALGITLSPRPPAALGK